MPTRRLTVTLDFPAKLAPAVWGMEVQGAPEERERPEAAMTPSETMKSVGIVQDGDPILGRPLRPFNFPAEAEDARGVAWLPN